MHGRSFVREAAFIPGELENLFPVGEVVQAEDHRSGALSSTWLLGVGPVGSVYHDRWLEVILAKHLGEKLSYEATEVSSLRLLFDSNHT